MIKTYPANNEIRQKMQMNGVSIWEIARALNLSELTIYRWFRADLTPDRQRMVEEALNAIIEGRRV